MGMRIDEFSSPSSWDGAIDSTEQTSFLLFGFNVPLVQGVETWVEYLCFDSPITTLVEFDSAIGSDCDG